MTHWRVDKFGAPRWLFSQKYRREIDACGFYTDLLEIEMIPVKPGVGFCFELYLSKGMWALAKYG
jgi:hypothetical protein